MGSLILHLQAFALKTLPQMRIDEPIRKTTEQGGCMPDETPFTPHGAPVRPGALARITPVCAKVPARPPHDFGLSANLLSRSGGVQ
jgi:hypothetical protein